MLIWTRRSPSGEVSTPITNVDLGLVAGRNLLGAFVGLAFAEPVIVAFDILWLQLPFLVEQSIGLQVVGRHKIYRIWCRQPAFDHN